MNNILRKVLGKYALVYLDDVIIFSKTAEEHITHIGDILDRIQKAGFKLKLSKCFFFQKSVPYLGQIISEEGSSTDPKKIEVVKNFPPPENRQQLKSALGLFGYYRKYIKNFGAIAHPLTELTKKDVDYVWGPDQESAFQTLKEKLISAPILGYPDFTEEFIVHTDASGYAVGAVLAQKPLVNGKRREVVIAYGSRHLTPTETRWSTLEKEFYAIIYAMENFHPYSYGPYFTVYTDHQPLVKILENPVKNETAKITRWILQTQLYDMTVVYRPGPLNANADGLSRIPWPTKAYQTPDETTAPICFVLEVLTTEQANDSYCKTAREKLNKRITDSAVKGEGNRKKRSVVKSRSTQAALQRDTLKPSRNITKFAMDPQDSDSDDDEFQELGNGLLATHTGKILAPESLRAKILFRFHDSPFAGHLGVKKTLSRIRNRYFWPNMNKEIKMYVRQCVICEKRKAFGSNKGTLSTDRPPIEALATHGNGRGGPVGTYRKGKRIYPSDGRILYEVYDC
jgi:hypothetical protein